MIKLSKIKKDQHQDKTIYLDLNCDLGEGFGIYHNNNELDLIQYVSSVSIPCGGHAGDAIKIMNALKIAREKSLSVGAHIGYPDLGSFGYREMNLSYDEIQAMVLYQVGALKSMAAAYGLVLNYVRPHGALYKQMATDAALAISIAKSIELIDHWLILVGASGNALNNVQEETKIRVAPEIIINRYYDNHGNILFDEPTIESPERIVEIATKLIKEGKLINKEGNLLEIEHKTIHLSSSGEHSLQIARQIRELFPEKPVAIPVTLVGDHALFEL